MLDLHPSLAPMEATAVDQVPTGPGWRYEPKWDGFRCLAFRDGSKVHLQSKSGQPLARYFPDMVLALASFRPKQFVLDGELVVPVQGGLSFDQLLLRIHPAQSRVLKLASEHPAWLIVFDILADEKGKSLVDRPLAERRKRLEAFAAKYFPRGGSIRLSPHSASLAQAKRWFGRVGGNLDGIIAKRQDSPYRSGERAGMVKVKPHRTADCVVGGFRYASGSRLVGSLLLGLYDDEGLLNHVGFTSGIKNSERAKLTDKLKRLIQPPGFTGRAPGGPSRWSTKRSTEWEPLAPKLVVEVGFDHFTGGRFRHGTHILRWRPDKAPRQCTFEQINHSGASTLKLLK